ncbi:MAG: PAS domain S-box protein, partial [Proteobacteria bacterium]|nr:PAS domain S-box protein [Pseudomonadota bacterium]
MLRTRVASMPHVLSIFVLDANGSGLFSSRSHPTPGVHAGDRSYFIAHEKQGATGLFISEPRRSRLSPDKWSFFLSRSLKGPGGDLKAVVVASIDLDYFESLYATIDLPAESSIALQHREGVVLASHPHSDAAIGRSYGSASHFARLLSQSEGAIQAAENENLDSGGSEQRALLASNSELRGYPLLVSLAVPLDAALAGWRYQSTVIGLGAAASGLLIAILTIWLFRQVAEGEVREATLRESEEQFRVAFEQVGVGMALLALDGRWTRVNQRLCDMLGYSQEELLERRFHDLTHPDDLDANVRYLGQSLEGKIPAYSMEKRYFRKDGSTIWVNLTVALVRNASGNPSHLISVVEDISKRKQAEQEVHDLNEGLEQQVEERTAELRESEQRLNLAARSANFGAWSRRIPGDEVIWDERTEAIFGLEPGTFKGTLDAFLARVHPDDRERIREGHRRFLQDGVPYAIDYRVILPDGSVRHVATRASLVRDDRDSSVQFIGMLQDITERKQIEEALRESEKQLRLITDNVPAGIAYVDANERYGFINKRYEEWFGISLDEAYGRRVSDVVGEAAYDIVKENLAKALSGERVAFETSLPIKNAGSRHVQATYVPHLSDDGSDDGGVKGVFVLVTDLTERKRLEDELLLRERLATLGQLTATVSHELRNPLGVIRTSAFILRDGLKEEMPRARRALERVERSVVRCDRIIDEMLDFTRMSDLEPEPTALDDWLAGVLEEQSLPTGISLRQELQLPNLTVALDRDRFRRAVINVFDNACQAMRGEGEAETEPAERVLTV